MTVKYKKASDCPDVAKHTKHPTGYLEFNTWSAKMSECHTQEQCPTCGYWSVWRDVDGKIV